MQFIDGKVLWAINSEWLLQHEVIIAQCSILLSNPKQICKETHSALIRANKTAPDAAVCKSFYKRVPASCQVINEANKKEIQLSVLTAADKVQPMFLCLHDEMLSKGRKCFTTPQLMILRKK